MATFPDKAGVALTGAVYVGPEGTTAPTSSSSALDAAFLDLGGLTPDGVTRTHPGEGDTTVLKYWQNGEQCRTLRSSSEDPLTYQMVIRDTTVAAVETQWDVTITQTATEGSYVIDAGKTPTVRALVFDLIDGAELERQHAPKASVTSVGDITYNGDDTVNLDLTFAADRDATLGGHVKVWSTWLKSA